MNAVRVSRNLIVMIALVVSLGANATLFVGGIVYSFVDELMEQAFDLDTPRAKQRRALAALKKENAGLRSANRKLRGRLGNVRHVANSAAKRSGARLLGSATRSVATLPGEALPVVGTVIAVAVTALEIKELCDTMRDFGEIQKSVGVSEAEAESELSVCSVRVPSGEKVVARMLVSGREAWDDSEKYVPDLPSWEEIQSKGRSYWPDIRDRFKSFWP